MSNNSTGSTTANSCASVISKNRNYTKYIVMSGVIAALYIVLTWICSVLGISSGVIQVRISEALCILPMFTPAAIPGLFIGCFISNIIAGGVIMDVIFGSIATLIGALGTYALRKRGPYLAILPPIIANTIIVPFVLKFAYHLEDAMWFMFVTVGAGEIISAGILGVLLYFALRKHQSIFHI